MRSGRYLAVEPRTPVAATPWKGRLRSDQETPPSAPTQRLPSRSKSRVEIKEVQTSKKDAALENKGTSHNDVVVCLPAASQSDSLRPTPCDPEHLIIIDDDEVSEPWNQDTRTPVAVGGTPWKGRLRSQQETSQSVPTQRLPSGVKNRVEIKKGQTSKKRAALQNKGRGRNCGAARLPAAPQSGSLRLTPSDPEHLIIIDDDQVSEECNGKDNQPAITPNDPEHPIIIDDDEVTEECKGKDNQSAIKPLRRSPRFDPENNNSCMQVLGKNNQPAIKSLRRSARLHTDDNNSCKLALPSDSGEITHNRKTGKALREDNSRSGLKRNNRNARTKRQKGPQEPCQGPQDVPPRNKIADLSCKNSGKQEVNPSHYERLTKKRKRGTRGKSSSERKRYQDPNSLPSDCQEVMPSNETRKSSDPSIKMHPKINKVVSEIVREGSDSDDWTEEQDMALRNAFFTARPSPHFWKKVSKMVPGRSAKECYHRIHADLSTPTPIGARPRKSKSFSPVGKFALSGPGVLNLLEPTVVRQRTTKQKSLAAQKIVRHLLRKQCLSDQAQEADHFSLFETSPSAIQLNISLEDSPGTPDSYLNSGSLNKCSGSSSARKKPHSRLRTKQAEPSPAVLKPIKNAVLHERYINQLSRRDGTKKPRRTPGFKPADGENCFPEKQANGLKAAKNALISEATDFISCFKKLQANSHVHIVENSEDDETDCIGCDASDDYCDDKE